MNSIALNSPAAIPLPEVTDVVRLDYRRALDIQHGLRDRLLDGRRNTGALLFFEHPEVITLGRRGGEEAILRRRFEVVKTDRGGLATFHGPGQLVGYPILRLDQFNLGPRRFVELIEKMIIDVLADLGISAAVSVGLPGVWVGADKIAAIGINIHAGVSTHGFAINLNPDLGAFEDIIPCGIADAGVTSIEQQLDRPPSIESLARAVGDSFCAHLKDAAEKTETGR